jgi:hypothetical protein
MKEIIVTTKYVRRNEMDDILVPLRVVSLRKKLKQKKRRNIRIGFQPAFSGALIVMLIFSLSFVLGRAGVTTSYFSDGDQTAGNVLSASFLDFSIEPSQIEVNIDIDPPDSGAIAPVMIPAPGSLPIEYKVTAEKTGGNDAFCNALFADSSDLPFIYFGPLTSLDVSPSIISGPWQLEISLQDAGGVNVGDTCLVDLVYLGWREGGGQNEGYMDEERVSLVINAIGPAVEQAVFGAFRIADEEVSGDELAGEEEILASTKVKEEEELEGGVLYETTETFEEDLNAVEEIKGEDEETSEVQKELIEVIEEPEEIESESQLENTEDIEQPEEQITKGVDIQTEVSE